jgi:hypothetical protein
MLWSNWMAASDRYTERLACPCGAVVVLHRVDRAYLDCDPEIERVTGPAIKVRAKRERLFSACHDDTDILCGRCGHVLHESKAPNGGQLIGSARERDN